MNSGENENTLFLSKEDEKKLIQETREEEKEDVDFIASLQIVRKHNFEKNERLETNDINVIKKKLKIKMINKGYVSIEDYAKKTKINYSPNTIRQSFSIKHKTSDRLLQKIASDLGVDLKIKKKVEKIFTLEM